MNRVTIGALFVLLFGLIGCVGIAQSPVWLSTTSPSKTYTVELSGNKSRPRVPFTEHKTRFNLVRSGQSVVRNAYVDSYDWFDPGFDDSYSVHEWVNESTLRFARDLLESSKSLDSLSIRNNTGKPIRYLKVTARDMLLIFDVPPASIITVSVPRQRWLSWITCEGEFVDGQRISQKGVNFFHRDTIQKPLQYCISINDRVSTIQSPQVDGFDGDGTGDNPNIAKASGCDL